MESRPEPKSKPEPESSSIVAWIGLDWADQEHHVCVQAVGSTQVEHQVVAQRPEALQDWVRQLRARFAQGRIAIAWSNRAGR